VADEAHFCNPLGRKFYRQRVLGERYVDQGFSVWPSLSNLYRKIQEIPAPVKPSLPAPLCPNFARLFHLKMP